MNYADYFFGRTVKTTHGQGNISSVDWNHPFPLIVKLEHGFDRFTFSEITFL